MSSSWEEHQRQQKMNDFKRRVYVVVLICLMYLPHTVVPYFQYPSVYWAPKNCRFNLNKSGKSRYEFKVKQFGKLYFVCPNIALWNDISNTGVQKSMMYENLMLVDEAGYDTCTVNRTRNPSLNRLILKCHDDASQLTYMEETFAPQRAGNDRMKYESGKTYYFISTSNGTKESLDNLSGGHCKTHNMKLKITVCKAEEQCFFDVPKCPFTDVFDGQNRPTTTTAAPKTTATTTAKHTPDVAGVETNLKTTQKVGTETVSKETETRKPTVQTTTTLPTTKAILAKHSSDNTIWGSKTQRTHIIIHIVMGLLILILTFCLIYVSFTRRKPKSKPVQFSSKLFQERPTSTIPLDSEINGAPHAV